jgi:uncharacterized membrane protein YtjA (UPF0391 family)
MLSWAFAFFAAAIIVAYLGIAGTEPSFAAMANVVFWIFMVGFVANLATWSWNSIRARRGSLRRAV